MPGDPMLEVKGTENGFPYIPAPVFATAQGTPYLRSPGVHLIAKPHVELDSLREFLAGFDSKLNFPQYLDDPVSLTAGTQLCKVAGQLCYASFGLRRSGNDAAGTYMGHIKESGHGSVLEHANYSMLCYGISRSITHELVRHRAGFGFSQLSQRYVSGKVLRFVERPEYVDDPELHSLFEGRIDRAAAEYENMAQVLVKRQKEGAQVLSADMGTDLRKKVQQTARSLLPNEVEAPIVITGNARAWRHVMEMRANTSAEVEIRALAYRFYCCLSRVDAHLFSDYRSVQLPDGTWAVETDYRKV